MAISMLEKLEAAAPYNIFYNKVDDNDSAEFIEFGDFLCPSLGKLQSSLYLIGKVDIHWLMEQYEEKNLGSTNITLLCHQDNEETEDVIKSYFPNVTYKCLKATDPSKKANNHAKLAMYMYDDESVRIVISTANLYPSQFKNFSHGFWVSPLCTRNTNPKDSSTEFKATLLRFLNCYDLDSLYPWTQLLAKLDFSDVQVCLITSEAGRKERAQVECHASQMEDLLSQHCFIDSGPWPIIAQPSSIGSLGKRASYWLQSYFLKSLSFHKHTSINERNSNLRIIYPTYSEVVNGSFQVDEGVGLRYSRNVHNKQKWLEDWLYKWQAEKYQRTKLMPHTKIYCRVSSNHTKMAWFLLTSANLNKSAWGNANYNPETGLDGKIVVRNFELGVLFLPKYFGMQYFYLKEGHHAAQKDFPLVFDLPLVKYSKNEDRPWTIQEVNEVNSTIH